jgi:hypothetical protein
MDKNIAPNLANSLIIPPTQHEAVADFCSRPIYYLIQDDPHEPTDLFKIINFIYCLLLGHV